jgi:hypothetical protein
MAPDKSSYPVLVYISPRDLLCKISHNLSSRRHPTSCKLVYLTNQRLFLYSREYRVVQVVGLLVGDSLALVTPHNSSTFQFVSPGYSSVIRD